MPKAKKAKAKVAKKVKAKAVKAKTAKKKTGFDVAAFEKKHDITIAKRYRKFLESGEGKKYAGLYVSELPHYDSDAKWKVAFLEPDFDIFDDNDIDRDDHPEYIPLSMLGEEPQFLAVDVTQEKCPVAMWEHEDGMFHAHSASLDEFLERLSTKSAPSKKQSLSKVIEKAGKLYDAEKFKEASAILEPALQEFDVLPPGTDEVPDEVENGLVRLGLIRKELGRIDDALRSFANAYAVGSVYGALNLLAYYDDPPYADEKIVTLTTALWDRYLDEHSIFWVKNYRGRALIRLGKKEEAEVEFRFILDRFGIDDEEKIKEGVSGIREEIIAKNAPNVAIAESILTWFKPKTYEVTADEAKGNRAWWDGLPAFSKAWQTKLREAIKLEGEGTPTDQEIARMLAVESLSFEKGDDTDDATPAARLLGIKRITLHGKLTTLDPLRALPNLKRVTVNSTVIKNLQLPGERSRSLFEAVEKGDIEAAKRALSDGACIFDKLEERSALHVATGKKDLAMARFLIEQGASATVFNKDWKYPLDLLGEEEKKELAARYDELFEQKRARSNLRVWKMKAHVPKACSLGYVQKFKQEYKLDDGEPLSDLFPKDAFIQMRADYPGYKKQTEVLDCHSSGYSIVVSKRIKDFLDAKGVVGVEYLPVDIQDHQGKVAARDYFVLNALGQDCLDLDESQPDYNHIAPEDISSIARLAIDESRVAADRSIFRIHAFSQPLIIRKDLAEALEGAGFTGLRFSDLVDFGG